MATYSSVRAILLAACAIWPLVPIAAAAQTGDPTAYNIRSPDLGTALTEVARQGNREIYFSSELTRGLRAPPLRGQMTMGQALERLLQGTGLHYRINSSGAIMIERRSGEGQADGVPAGNEGVDAAQTGVAEILVVGTRSQNADIRRTESDAQPYVVFDRREIEHSQAANLEDFFRTRLPMNTSPTAFSQVNGSTSGSTSTIQLRGLPPGQTLILVDGRRLPGKTTGPDQGQPDINGIALSSIERIEVLPSTASGIYGGGATGGVINIITRRDYQGLETSLRYGSTFRGDASEISFGIAGGFALSEGRTRISFSANHRESNALLQRDRDFVERARSLQFRNNPGAFYALTSPPLGLVTNIRSQNGANLVFDNGTPLNAPRTFVPFGYAGVASDGGAALLTNAGIYNLDVPPGQNGAMERLLPDISATSLTASIRQQVSDRLELYGNVFWSENDSRSGGTVLTSTATIGANAPNNPFTTPINVSFSVPGVLTSVDTNSSSISATGGGIFRLSPRWTISLDHVWSRSRFGFDRTFPVLNAAFATAAQNGAFDVVRDLNVATLNLSPYLLTSPNYIFGPLDTVSNETTLRVSGSVLRLPADWIQVTGLLQRRNQVSKPGFLSQVNSAGTPSTTYYPQRSQNVSSAYLEAVVPLVSAAMGVPLVHELSVQASVRYDNYETRNASAITIASSAGPLPDPVRQTAESSDVSYLLGVRYRPTSDVQLRASYGTGFLPPTLSQLLPSSVLAGFQQSLMDPRRGGAQALTGPFDLVAFGGGGYLEPERSRSFSAGIILTPRFMAGFRLSVDYTRISKTGEISSLTAQQALTFESSFPDRVIRADLTDQDRALGYTGGVIRRIDISLLNFARTRVEAYDIQADYRFDTPLGAFSPYLVASFQRSFARSTVPGAAFVDVAGYAEFGPRLRGTGGINWTRGRLSASWTAQFIDSYKVYFANNPASRDSIVLNQGSDRVREQWYHDLLVSYRFPEASGPLSGLRADVGVQNIFDSKPSVLASTTTSQTYSFLGDPRLRRFTLGLTFPF